MQEKDSIQILEEMQTGVICSIELPLTNSMKSDVISIYLEKDKDGRYNFFDGGGAIGTFKMPKEFILKRDIRIAKMNNEEQIKGLYIALKRQEIKDKHKLRDSR